MSLDRREMHLIKLSLRLSHNDNFPNIKFEECEVCQNILIKLRKLIKNKMKDR